MTKTTRIKCRHLGIVAELILPEGNLKVAAIMVLGGSDGGIGYARSVAIKLAENGYAAFAVAYFKEAGLPSKLCQIPLEYFAQALDWLRQQPRIDANCIGLYGVSKGAEAALLIGCRDTKITALVTVSPSDVAWEGIDFRAKTSLGSSWSEKDMQVAYIPYDRQFKTRSVLEMYRHSRRIRDSNPAAIIPVERLNGAILFLSGGADALWPSQEMSEDAMERLADAGFSHSKQHVYYSGAGHAIFPLFRWQDHLMAFLLSKIFGGNGQKNRIAREDAWRKTLIFFENNLVVNEITVKEYAQL